MKNSKGITMASLVIIITSIVLLSAMAISFGYKYLNETKKADEEYFKEVLSSAVTKRENNHTVNSPEYPREGYYISTLEAFQKILDDYVPELKDNGEILFDRGLWYIVDDKAAGDLGVKSSADYIDTFDPNLDNDTKIKVALVDYYSGTVIIIKFDRLSEIEGISGDKDIIPDNGHEHNFNIEEPTCTLDKKCLICGYVEKVAKGHVYEYGEKAEAIDDEFHFVKKCSVCGMQGGYERHIDLNKYYWTNTYSEDGWYHYKYCRECEWPSPNINYESCEIVWRSISDTQHVQECKICKHQNPYNHVLEYVCIDKNYHEYICRICGYKKIKYELHEDDGTGKCGKCGCEMPIGGGEEPLLVEVLLKNKEWPESKYATDGETIQLIITADRMISDVDANICGYGGDNLKKTYSDDKLTCTIELFIDNDIVIAQNSRISFSVACKSVSSDKWMTYPVSETTDDESYLIYDSVAPEIDYIYKSEY